MNNQEFKKNNNPVLGFSLALLASMTWGSVPIIIKQVLTVMDTETLVWSRFIFASSILFLIGFFRGKLPKKIIFNQKILILLLIGSLALAMNFFLSSNALNYVSPTTTQVLWQLAPFGMMVSGIFVFGEKMGVFQKTGLILLLIGLILFFNQNFSEILQFGSYAKGIFLAMAGSLIWVIYGIIQKILLPKFSSPQILMMIYFGCAIWLSPFVSPTQITDLIQNNYNHNLFIIICFIYCCINTLIGYGAYGEALNHWDTSKVSVITTMLPIFTMIFSALANWIAPTIFPPLNMNILSYLGAIIVVSGAILAVVGDKLFNQK